MFLIERHRSYDTEMCGYTNLKLFNNCHISFHENLET